MKCKFKFSTVMELGVGAATIAALLLAGCGGGGGGGGGAAAGASMVITPALGQFASGATVRVKDKNGSLLATGTVNANGVAAVTVPAGATAPLLVEAGINGDKYFDENPAAAGRDANGFVTISGVASAAVRALIPDTTTTAVGVTALTEMAVGQIEAASGIAATPVADIRAVNQTIGDTMGVADILQPPTPVATATRLNTTSLAADRYALVLAGLAHMAAAGKTALDVANDLRNDVKDGKFDGRIGPTAATAFDPAKFTPPALGATNTAIGAALTAALNNTLSTATTQLALSGTAPTVAIATVDLSAYKAAIIAVQATAPAGAGQVASAQPFPLQSGYNARVANGYSANYTISGTCSGTENIVWSPPAAGIFEGASALGSAASYAITITTPSCGAAVSGATTGTRYYDTSYAYLGSSFPGQYTVPTSPITVPASVRVGDTGTLGTANIYTDSTKAVLLGQYVFSYAVEPDTATTAIINLITKRYSSSVLIATEQERSRIASDGTLTPISIDKQSNTSADYLILIAANGGGTTTTGGPGITPSGSVSSYNLTGVTANGVTLGGNLIAPVTVGSHTYYHWDVSGDGTSADVDGVTHDLLDQIFNGGALGDTTKDTTETTGNTVTLSNGVRIHLPTHTELAAIYTANGGVPAAWARYHPIYQTAALNTYWTATQAPGVMFGGHYYIMPHGLIPVMYDPVRLEVVFEVL